MQLHVRDVFVVHVALCLTHLVMLSENYALSVFLFNEVFGNAILYVKEKYRLSFAS